jgi:sugar phosphate isomerase/epimerase
MNRKQAAREALALANKLGAPVIVYHMTAPHSYGIRAARAPGKELLRVAHTIHPRQLQPKPVAISFVDQPQERNS